MGSTATSRIWRRRALTGITVSVVAAAIITPVAFLTLSDGDPAPSPAPAAQSPTSVPLTDVTLTADSPEVSDTGGWFTQGENNAGMPSTATPEGSDQVSRLGDRWLLSLSVEENRFVRLLGHDNGAVVQEFAQNTHFAISDDLDLAAFTTPEGELLLVDGSGTSRVFATLPYGESAASPIGVTGGAGCVDESATQGCQVLLDHVDGQGPVTVTEGGRLRQVDPSAEYADASNGTVVALRDATAPGADAPCTRVVDLSGEQLWKSCDIGVESFSTDGRHVAVVDAYQSGWGPKRVGIADAATGELLFWITPEGNDASVADVGWAGINHLMASTYDPVTQQWRLFSVSTDGEVAQAHEPVTGDDTAFPFIPWVNP